MVHNPIVFGWVLLFVVPHIAASQLLVARVMPKLNTKSLEAAAKNTGELTALITCADVTLYTTIRLSYETFYKKQS
jgi:uncharacterized membrane protein